MIIIYLFLLECVLVCEGHITTLENDSSFSPHGFVDSNLDFQAWRNAPSPTESPKS